MTKIASKVRSWLAESSKALVAFAISLSHPSGQSYKPYMIINYDFRVLVTSKLPRYITTL